MVGESYGAHEDGFLGPGNVGLRSDYCLGLQGVKALTHSDVEAHCYLLEIWFCRRSTTQQCLDIALVTSLGVGRQVSVDRLHFLTLPGLAWTLSGASPAPPFASDPLAI